MNWYNQNDIELQYKLDDIKHDMVIALEYIKNCNADSESEFNTDILERDIKRFLEDH